MSKGIAIQTILYLLLGVLVVGIIIYLVYTYSTGESMDIQEPSDCTGCHDEKERTIAAVISSTARLGND